MGTLLRPFSRAGRVGAWRRLRGPAIPLATTAELTPAVRRTLALRVLFAAALIGLAVAASETGRSNAAAARGLLLVSDLDTAPDDVPRVAETFNTFRNQGVPFRIIPVAPRADNLSLFQSIAGKKAFAKPVRSAAGASDQTEGAHRGQTPWTLISLALVLLAALAANEHWCGRLPVPRTQS